MKILNLTSLEASEIKYEVSKFPDGQQQVKITSTYWDYCSDFKQFQKKDIVKIKSRLNNFKDLELIICTVASLRNLGIKEIHLYTPYFLGSRSDRKFEEGSNNYLKDVICPIINSLNFESVTVIDNHSDVLEACLNNFKKIDNLCLVKYSIIDIFTDKTYKKDSNPQWEHVQRDILKNEDYVLISPDAGANKKIFKVAEQIGYTGDVITCSKSRDENGKLSRVQVPFTHYQNIDKDIIIIDDICDGGATFINIAQAIKVQSNHWKIKPKIYLIVTHGIFSKGFKELNKYFDGIYCTNSYRDVVDNEYDEVTNVKQLNVF